MISNCFQWHWLLIDLPDLMTNLISQSYQSLEFLSVCGSCKIRSIATVRDFITSPGDLPSSWQPPPSVPPLNIYVVNSNLFSSSVPHAPQTKSEAASMHIAFGEKIAIPSHVARTQQRKVEASKQQTHSLPTGSKANSRAAALRPVTLKPTDNICIDSTVKEKELNSQASHFAYVSPPHSTASSNKTHSNSQETDSRKTQSHSREAHSHSEETHSHFQAPEKVSHIQTPTVHSGTRERKSINLEEDFLSLSAINGGSPRRDLLANNE
ncbi:PREDICTED: uncharacterized protein LOC109593192, partial [Amphimedon queenslandica]|uniref:Uncharacterized protein n=2 Tax=Amphimedon queenslandica TaxID=400682 RepID=A0AAN0K3S0_AMPQE